MIYLKSKKGGNSLKLWTNRNLSYFVIAITVIAMGVLAYYTFNVYGEYNEIEKKVEQQRLVTEQKNQTHETQIVFQNKTLQLENQLLHKEREVNKYILIFLLLLILLGFILVTLRVMYKMSSEKHFLQDTLREIELDLDENKQQELKSLIERNDRSEIYTFLADAIKEPSRAKDLFLANMSHEIRTPLNGIVGFTRELQETELNEDQKEMLDIIEESSNHLIHIVNDILDFSKLKAGKVELESIPFNPMTKFETAIDTFVAKARENDIELKVNIDPHIPQELRGDPTKVLQILNNLISNAIKFTVRGGTVEISILQLLSSSKEVSLKFVVKDSGIGVDVEEKKRIFDEFSQADASTSRKYGGTGLGLSISSQFVKHMGGKLQIESEVGEGSSFYFSLNFDKTSKSIAAKKKNLQQFHVGYILPKNSRIVDKYLKTYVQYQGAKFEEYEPQAVLTLKEEKLPDLLFIDYRCFEKQEDLESFLRLPTKTALMVAENREDELVAVRDKIDSILHKPVNFTRTAKVLDILDNIRKKELVKNENDTLKFNGQKALVVEDNLINQKLIKSILSRLGISVTVVGNGAEAVTHREKENCDIIFMDIQMPVMGGIEATKKILNLEKEQGKRHIPIVALTANALEGDREKYLAIGMDAYLAKPMKIKELEKVLVSFL
jgi:signal transduction histidine kinase/CheY-like chemotaxis protein